MYDFKLFDPYIKEWREAEPKITAVAMMLHHWIYYSAYNLMVQRLRERVATTDGLNQEINRVNTLLTHFLSHMDRFAGDHIRPDKRQILDETIVGDWADFQRWHDAGYNPSLNGGLPRSARTYTARLKVWQEIYNGEFTVLVGKSLKTVTYEEVVSARMSLGITNQQVPYWMLWNYGSDYRTNRDGYPAYSGIHFLEAGENSLSGFGKRAVTLLKDYIVSLLIKRKDKLPIVLSNPDWKELYAVYRGKAGISAES